MALCAKVFVNEFDRIQCSYTIYTEISCASVKYHHLSSIVLGQLYVVCDERVTDYFFVLSYQHAYLHKVTTITY